MISFDNFQSAEWIFNLTLRSLLLAALTWLILKLTAGKSAPLRSGISLAAMAALLILPLLTSPIIPFPTKCLKTPLIGIESTEVVDAVTSVSLEAAPRRDRPSHQFSAIFPLATTSQPEEAVAPLPRMKPSFLVSLSNGFGLIWLTVSILFFFRLIYGTASAFSLVRNSTPSRDGRLALILERAGNSFRKSLNTQVMETSGVGGIMTVGIFSPKILLPTDLVHSLSDSKIQGILLHELSHIHHRDQVFGIIQRIFTALFWWNPMTQKISIEFSRAREEVSDTHVLLQNDSKDYARCLIDLAEISSMEPMPVSALASPHIPLTERVKNILSKERNMDTKLKSPTVAAIIAVSFFCLALAAGNGLTYLEVSVVQSLASTDIEQPRNYAESMLHEEQSGQNIKPAKLVKKVEPVYPEEAVEKGLEDTVVIQGKTDTEGNVVNVKVLKGEHDILNQAALDAIKQWKYEPMEIDGKAKAISFTVSCRFRKDPQKKNAVTVKSAEAGEEDNPPVHASHDLYKPRLTKRVEPIYPEEAKKNEIEGVVIIEATTNTKGDVIDTKVLRSIPALDQAALDALKQWKYEPMIINDQPYGVIFVVTVRFKLK